MGKYTETNTSGFSALIADFITLIYPHYCVGCDAGLLKGEELICTACILDLPKTNYHLHQANPVFNRLYGRLPLAHAFAFLLYQKGGKVQRLMQQLKYNNRPEVGYTLGRVYGDELASMFSNSFDIIIPVPLHEVKLRRRGYNQSEQFARGLGESLKITMEAQAVVRLEATQTQTRKSKLKRWQNVDNVFSVPNRDPVQDKRVLLVDDVITTGATLEACGNALVSAGCSQLSVAGLAYAHE